MRFFSRRQSICKFHAVFVFVMKLTTGWLIKSTLFERQWTKHLLHDLLTPADYITIFISQKYIENHMRQLATRYSWVAFQRLLLKRDKLNEICLQDFIISSYGIDFEFEILVFLDIFSMIESPWFLSNDCSCCNYTVFYRMESLNIQFACH